MIYLIEQWKYILELFYLLIIIENNSNLIKEGKFYKEDELNKRKDKPEINLKGKFYCFNFSSSNQILLGTSGNCTDENGRRYIIRLIC